MNAVFRHLSVRFWGTALAGVLICTLVLPLWQRLAGMEWIALPVTIVFVGLFFAIGWMMNQIGVILVRRQLAEATAWERAGMLSEAEAAFDAVKSTHDSFWLSPLQRQRNSEWVSGRLARFYLAQPSISSAGRQVVDAYLRIRPEDEAVARAWIEAAAQQTNHRSEALDLAAMIGEAQSANERIQHLLAELYLSQGRFDFEALQTYRRAWHASGGFSAELIPALCDLLLKEGFINNWALDVYLRGHAAGDDACIEGLAAGICRLKPHSANRDNLDAAKAALAHLSDDQIKELTWRFQPIESPGDPELASPPESQPSATPSSSTATVRALMERTIGAGLRVADSGGAHLRRMISWAAKSPPRVRWLGALAVLLFVGVTVLTAQWPSGTELPAVPPAIAPLEPQPQVTQDPFTIQVAAYLKREDAQRFVEGLKASGVAAFFTQAKSANRTWYQVKVSHFATKEAARAYGESLKTKGLIDDFYVANYTP